MGDAKTCSNTISTTSETKVICGHCGAVNYIYEEIIWPDDDASKLDIEAVTCWKCGQDSLIDLLLLEFYPLGVEEMVRTEEGKSVSVFT